MTLQLVVGQIKVGQLRKGVDGVWKALEPVAAEVEVGQGFVVSDNVGYLSESRVTALEFGVQN